MDNRELKLAEDIRISCIEAVKDGFNDASMSGLCMDGAMEAAISAVQKLDLTKLIEKHQKNEL